MQYVTESHNLFSGPFKKLGTNEANDLAGGIWIPE